MSRPTRLPRAWLRANAHPRFWLRYRPWKGIGLILGALIPAFFIASRGTDADARLGALIWGGTFVFALLWATSYDHEAYTAAQAGCYPDHAWQPADAISKSLQPLAKETCPRCGTWR